MAENNGDQKSVTLQKCDGAFKLVIDNDKNAVILAVLVIVTYSLYVLGVDAKEIASNAISGLFGIAVGRSTK